MSEQSKNVGEFKMGELADHRLPPIYDRRIVKAGGKIEWGQVVKVADDGSISAAAAGEEPYGIANENVDAKEDTYATIIIFGSVKKSNVKVGTAAITDPDVILLKKAGVYVLN